MRGRGQSKALHAPNSAPARPPMGLLGSASYFAGAISGSPERAWQGHSGGQAIGREGATNARPVAAQDSSLRSCSAHPF